MNRLQDIELGTLQPQELPLAARVAARGMRDNPSSIALIGSDPVWREKALEPTYQWILSSLPRPFLVARRNGVIVGLATLAPTDRCFYRRLAERQKTILVGKTRVGVAVPSLPRNLFFPLLRLGPGALVRLSTWGEAGAQHDPQERHQHVELVAVEAGLQGLGIGHLMMEELCRDMDKEAELSYLETDKSENVRFYEHFGFEVADEATVLQTRIWYMQRRPNARGNQADPPLNEER